MNERDDTLIRTDDGLALTDGVMTVRADFARMLPRLRANNLARELLVKAAKIKGAHGVLTAVDATAGLGDDSLLLAAAGYRVTMFERNPTIAALLRDALERTKEHEDAVLAQAVARMRLIEGDSAQALPHLDFAPDVVLLDPMFPAKHKVSAAKKKLQMLQHLETPCDDEAGLIDAAIAAGPRKVIVKRPIKGPHLAGRKPAYALSGKAIRYDVYVIPRTE